jgi:hypothetical protein
MDHVVPLSLSSTYTRMHADAFTSLVRMAVEDGSSWHWYSHWIFPSSFRVAHVEDERQGRAVRVEVSLLLAFFVSSFLPPPPP